MNGVKRSPIKRMVKPRRFQGIAKAKSKRGGVGKVPSISKLIKKADSLFSIQVRNRMASGDINMCYTCRNFFPIKSLHAGHYLSRRFKVARWNEDNARPQCFACNIMRKGDPIKFRNNLIQEIGAERVEAVEALRDAPIKLTREYLEELILTLQQQTS